MSKAETNPKAMIREAFKHLLGRDAQSEWTALVDQAKERGEEKELADACVGILKTIGKLPEPEGTLHRYLEFPEDFRRPMNSYGSWGKDIREHIGNYRDAYESNEKPVFLDVGGNKGECAQFSEGYSYWLVDLAPQTEDADRVIKGDICAPLPIEPGSVDVVFSSQVWEHLERPWRACRELGKLLRPGGLFVTVTLFAYRYHPLPEDFFRYTHVGLASIHNEYANTETVLCNYDVSRRRVDMRGGGHTRGSDMPPVDWFGGFRENWYVYYIGKKKG